MNTKFQFIWISAILEHLQERLDDYEGTHFNKHKLKNLTKATKKEIDSIIGSEVFNKFYISGGAEGVSFTVEQIDILFNEFKKQMK
jgi:hypothetical protein